MALILDVYTENASSFGIRDILRFGIKIENDLLQPTETNESRFYVYRLRWNVTLDTNNF